MIVVFKHRLEVQTYVCSLQTCVCRLIVHLACHTYCAALKTGSAATIRNSFDIIYDLNPRLISVEYV